MSGYSEHNKIPAENFMGTLEVNVNNPELSDKMFRELVRNTLPIVDYPRVKKDDEDVE